MIVFTLEALALLITERDVTVFSQKAIPLGSGLLCTLQNLSLFALTEHGANHPQDDTQGQDQQHNEPAFDDPQA